VLARLQICRAENFLGDWGRDADAGRRREPWRTGDDELSTFDCHVLLVAATLSHAFATAQNVSSCSCIAVLACN
jgi:hypothetical protein